MGISKAHPTPVQQPAAFPSDLRARLRARIQETLAGAVPVAPSAPGGYQVALAELLTRAVVGALLDGTTWTDCRETGEGALTLFVPREHRMVLGACLETLLRGESLRPNDQAFMQAFAASVRPTL